MSEKIDRRKLKTKKEIVTISYNEKNDSFDVTLGGRITSEQVLAGLVFTLETLADLQGLKRHQTLNQFLVYWNARIVEE